jgi:hypothetical protein
MEPAASPTGVELQASQRVDRVERRCQTRHVAHYNPRRKPVERRVMAGDRCGPNALGAVACGTLIVDRQLRTSAGFSRCQIRVAIETHR